MFLVGLKTLCAMNKQLVTYVSKLVFALGAATHITQSPDVLLPEAVLIVVHPDAVFIDDKLHRRAVLSPGGHLAGLVARDFTPSIPVA